MTADPISAALDPLVHPRGGDGKFTLGLASRVQELSDLLDHESDDEEFQALQRRARVMLNLAQSAPDISRYQYLQFAHNYLTRASEFVGESSAERSERVKHQLRDKHGQWIKMHAHVTFIKFDGGPMHHGTVVGSDEGGNVHVKVADTNAVAVVPAERIEVILATIGDHQTPSSGVQTSAEAHTSPLDSNFWIKPINKPSLPDLTSRVFAETLRHGDWVDSFDATHGSSTTHFIVGDMYGAPGATTTHLVHTDDFTPDPSEAQLVAIRRELVHQDGVTRWRAVGVFKDADGHHFAAFLTEGGPDWEPADPDLKKPRAAESLPHNEIDPTVVPDGFQIAEITGATALERTALFNYRGMAYSDLNDELRAGHSDNPLVEPLDSLMSRSVLNQDVVLYRGLDSDVLPDDLTPGSSLQDSGYVSTSSANDAWEEFGDVLMVVHAPAGTHAIDLQSTFSEDDNSTEHEFLLPRGSTFSVESDKHDQHGTRIITVSVDSVSEPKQQPEAVLPSSATVLGQDKHGNDIIEGTEVTHPKKGLGLVTGTVLSGGGSSLWYKVKRNNAGIVDNVHRDNITVANAPTAPDAPPKKDTQEWFNTDPALDAKNLDVKDPDLGEKWREDPLYDHPEQPKWSYKADEPTPSIEVGAGYVAMKPGQKHANWHGAGPQKETKVVLSIKAPGTSFQNGGQGFVLVRYEDGREEIEAATNFKGKRTFDPVPGNSKEHLNDTTSQGPEAQPGVPGPDQVEGGPGQGDAPAEVGAAPPFSILDDPGESGDGYAAPGLWGKYGASGVMLRNVGDDGTERFLLVQRGPGVSSNQGKWQLPGGALDSKETTYQAAARETHEELGVDKDTIAGFSPVGETVFEHPSGWKYTNIAADSPTAFEPNVDGHETIDAKWFTRDEVEKLRDDGDLVPAFGKNVDSVLAHFAPPASLPNKEPSNDNFPPDVIHRDGWTREVINDEPPGEGGEWHYTAVDGYVISTDGDEWQAYGPDDDEIGSPTTSFERAEAQVRAHRAGAVDVDYEEIDDTEAEEISAEIVPGASGNSTDPSVDDLDNLADWEKELLGIPLGDTSATSQPMDVTGWKQIGGQGGSNEGGMYESPEGVKWYIKVPQSPEHAHNEAVASKFYRELGINVPEVQVATRDGSPVIASRIIDGSVANFAQKRHDPAYLAKIQDGFAVDAWLANWDVAGLFYDNVVTGGDGDPWRIDTGGALIYRAQGLPKGAAFGNVAGEIDTLRDPHLNAQNSQVFGDMTDEEIAKSAQKVADLTPERISQIIDEQGFSPETATSLKEKLLARREYLINRFNLTPQPKETSEPDPAPAVETSVPDLNLDHPSALLFEDATTVESLEVGDVYYGIAYKDDNGNGYPTGDVYKVTAIGPVDESTVSVSVVDQHGAKDEAWFGNGYVLWKARAGETSFVNQVEVIKGNTDAPGLSSEPDDDTPFQYGHGNVKIKVGDKVVSLTDGLEGEVVKLEGNGLYVKVKGPDGKVKGRKATTLKHQTPQVEQHDPPEVNELGEVSVHKTDKLSEDGKPLLFGDHVIDSESGYEGTIDGFSEDGDYAYVTADNDKSGLPKKIAVSQLYDPGPKGIPPGIDDVTAPSTATDEHGDTINLGDTIVTTSGDSGTVESISPDGQSITYTPKNGGSPKQVSINDATKDTSLEPGNTGTQVIDTFNNPVSIGDEIQIPYLQQSGTIVGFSLDNETVFYVLTGEDESAGALAIPIELIKLKDASTRASGTPIVDKDGFELHVGDEVAHGSVKGPIHSFSLDGKSLYIDRGPNQSKWYVEAKKVQKTKLSDEDKAPPGEVPTEGQLVEMSLGNSHVMFNDDGSINVTDADALNALSLVDYAETPLMAYQIGQVLHGLAKPSDYSLATQQIIKTLDKHVENIDLHPGKVEEDDFPNMNTLDDLSIEDDLIAAIVKALKISIGLEAPTKVDTPAEPEPVTPDYTPIPGDKSIPSKYGVPIFKGSTVRSTKDGLEGKVVTVENNGQYVKVLGPDGKVKGRKADTLDVLAHPNGNAPTSAGVGGVTKPANTDHNASEWKGKPAPTAPDPAQFEAKPFVDEAWVESVKEMYKTTTPNGKLLINSYNMTRVNKIVSDGSVTDLDYFLNKKYISQEIYDAGLAQINAEHDRRAALKAVQDAVMADYVKKYTAWQLANSAPPPVAGPADWSKALPGTHTIEAARSQISASPLAGNRGASVAVDGVDVEDLDVRITAVRAIDGTPMHEYKFKLAPARGENFFSTVLGSDPNWTSKDLVIQRRTGVGHDSVGKLEADGKYRSSSGKTFRRLLPNGGEIVVHRSNSKSKTGSHPTAFHNLVQIRLPVDATEEEVANALMAAGVRSPRPATAMDVRAFAENRLVSIFGRDTNAWSQLNPAQKATTLANIKAEWDVTPDDLSLGTGAAGRFELRLPQAAVDKIKAKTGVSSFHHRISVPSSYPGGTAAYLADFFGGSQGAVLSTTQRWSEGIGVSGSSSTPDVRTGGADYVFLSPMSGSGTLGGHTYGILFSADEIFRRSDIYANKTDEFGNRFDNHDVYGNIKPGYYETMLKHRVPFDAAVGISLGQYRAEVIQILESRGITKIGGRDLEDIFVPPGTSVPFSSTNYVPADPGITIAEVMGIMNEGGQ